MRLTAEEFYKDMAGWDRSTDLATQHIEPGFLFEIMDAYASYCEETAWISVKDHLPELDKDSTNGSEFILGFNDGFEGRCWYNFDLKVFMDMRGNLIHLTHWRRLPAAPKQ